MSAANDLLGNYQHVISELTLIPGGGGVFEVEVDGNLMFSKKSLGRHANDGEVLELFTALVGPDVLRYGT